MSDNNKENMVDRKAMDNKKKYWYNKKKREKANNSGRVADVKDLQKLKEFFDTNYRNR